MARPPATEQVQVNFRMPAELRDRIKAAAEKNSRSMNAEIVHALEKAFISEKNSDEDKNMPARSIHGDARVDTMMFEIGKILEKYSLENWKKKEYD